MTIVVVLLVILGVLLAGTGVWDVSRPLWARVFCVVVGMVMVLANAFPGDYWPLRSSDDWVAGDTYPY